jgi:hypothetical protein
MYLAISEAIIHIQSMRKKPLTYIQPCRAKSLHPSHTVNSITPKHSSSLPSFTFTFAYFFAACRCHCITLSNTAFPSPTTESPWQGMIFSNPQPLILLML